jgi:hypothetical protein
MPQPPVTAVSVLLALSASASIQAWAGSPADVPPLVLSEILADPAALADAQGEFIELGNPRADSVFPESVSVSIDGRVLFLGALRLGPGDCFLVCRDSAAYAAAGIPCRAGWDGMSLANSRPLAAALAWKGGGYQATVPASRAGVSWENTWEAAAGYSGFRASEAARAGGDSATPGIPNGRGAGPAGTSPARWSIEPRSGNVQVTIEAPGAPPARSERILLRLDADWDGSAERLLDSAALDGSAPFPRVISLACPADARGRLEASLGPDEGPGEEVLSLAWEPGGGPLAFGSFRAAATEGEPEWLEIRNGTGSARFPPRTIGMVALALDGQPLGLKGAALGPGESLILTSDTAAFRARYGAVKARAARPSRWRALRNSGDTLVLSACGFPADTLAWGAIRTELPERGGSGTVPEKEGWSLSGRAAFPAAPLEVEVRSPVGRGYALRAFDLEGQCVREIGKGGPGRRTHGWDGRGERGVALPRGAYVLCLSFEGGSTRKRAVAAGGR